MYQRKVVPVPGSLSSVIQPSCCLTIPYTVESPSPVPRPSPLVVKKGSKTRRCVATSIPTPLSAIERTMYSPRRAYGYTRQYSSPITTFSARTQIVFPSASRPPPLPPSPFPLSPPPALSPRFLHHPSPP